MVGPELDFAGSPLEVLAENVILLRYVEFQGDLRRILSILKMRDTMHDHSIRQYEIGGEGIRVLSRQESAEGLLTGIARLPSERRVKRRGTAAGPRREDETVSTPDASARCPVAADHRARARRPRGGRPTSRRGSRAPSASSTRSCPR